VDVEAVGFVEPTGIAVGRGQQQRHA
jgi:hypothetical protein